MPVASIPLTSFTGGEWSPRLHGRVDIQKYNTACEILQNMIIYPHGGITRRPGMEFIEDAAAENVRLIPFEYNREQAYVLEFSHEKIRFFRNGAQILDEFDAPLEVATPYQGTELASLSFAQSNDVLYIVHQNHEVATLERDGPDEFTLADVTFTGKPTEWAGTNWPRVVTFFQERLVLGGTPAQPQTFWMSKVSDLHVFTLGTGSGAKKYSLSSTQNNAIQWIVPSSKLMIGTTGGEFSFVLPDNADNPLVRRESNFGSKSGRTQLIGTGVIYVSRDEKKIREMTYSFNEDSYISPEISLLSEHITRSGIKEFDYAQNPDGILWLVLGDGGIAGFTYLKSQEVQAWHRHVTDGVVKSVCTIETDISSEVWFAVYRNGATRIERMAQPFEGVSPNDINCAYLDSFLTYEGEPVSSLSGLEHLEGKTVSVLGNGFHLTNKVVTDGEIELEIPCSKVVVGLPYEWKVVPLRLEGGSPSGFSQGKQKRITEIDVRLERSAGINHKIKNGSLATKMPERKFGDPMDTPITLFSGDMKFKLNNKWDTDGQFELFGSAPFPVTILMIGASLTVNK